VQTSRLEAEVHFTPTTRTCECLGLLWRDQLILDVSSANDRRFLELMRPRYQITVWGSCPFLEGGVKFFLGGVVGEGVVGDAALTVSAKLLREDAVSLLRSSIFLSIAVTTGATSTTGAGGGGPAGVVWRGISLISLWISRSCCWRSFSK